ncbi:hypothetical protein K474DRAFT_1366060 [Panus rudis PR-1116 ss-1]|nr:hypothetical protein K474DRAFT_1366060 [Panus rudis PR-1116 ss-1]
MSAMQTATEYSNIAKSKVRQTIRGTRNQMTISNTTFVMSPPDPHTCPSCGCVLCHRTFNENLQLRQLPLSPSVLLTRSSLHRLLFSWVSSYRLCVLVELDQTLQQALPLPRSSLNGPSQHCQTVRTRSRFFTPQHRMDLHINLQSKSPLHGSIRSHPFAFCSPELD